MRNKIQKEEILNRYLASRAGYYSWNVPVHNTAVEENKNTVNKMAKYIFKKIGIYQG